MSYSLIISCIEFHCMADTTVDIAILDGACAFFGVEAMNDLRSKITDQLPDTDITIARTPAESITAMETAEIVLTHTLPEGSLDRATELQWVQALSAGVDMYDINALRDRDIALTSVSGVHAEPIAEQVLGYMLLFERNILTGIQQQRHNMWELYTGGELRGQTLGIVGIGSIGTRVAELGDTFGMCVVGTKRDTEAVPDAVEEVFSPDELDAVLKQSDYLVLACPLTDETHRLIGRRELDIMHSSAILVNVSRGPVVDESALVTALQQGRLGGAALDVFEVEPLPSESQLWTLSNVVITPHMAGYTPKLWERIADVFAANYERYCSGETLRNRTHC